MRCQIIGEISTNHCGDVELACEMVRAAADAGCDYAKIQTYSLERLNPADPQADWLRQAHLDREDHQRVIEACQEAGIAFLSTPFDAGSLAMLRELGLTTFKIASSESANDWWDPTHGEQWFVSWPWGICTMKPWINTGIKRVELTAIPLYPTPLEAAGRASLLTGWSDHTIGLSACQWAIANGAKVVEVHMHDAQRRGRVSVWDKSPEQIRQLRAFADDVETMRSGVAQRFRERWTA